MGTNTKYYPVKNGENSLTFIGGEAVITIKQFDNYKKAFKFEGAAAERARLREAVLNLGGLKIGENDYVILKSVLSLLKDGDGE